MTQVCMILANWVGTPPDAEGLILVWNLTPDGLLTARDAPIGLADSGGGLALSTEQPAGAAGAADRMFTCCVFLPTGLLIAGSSSGEVWCWAPGVSGLLSRHLAPPAY